MLVEAAAVVPSVTDVTGRIAAQLGLGPRVATPRIAALAIVAGVTSAIAIGLALRASSAITGKICGRVKDRLRPSGKRPHERGVALHLLVNTCQGVVEHGGH